MQSERGKKSAEVRGLGFGSRKDFVLQAEWKTEETDSGTRKMIVSPGKTKYRSFKKVKQTIDNENCLHNHSLKPYHSSN